MSCSESEMECIPVGLERNLTKDCLKEDAIIESPYFLHRIKEFENDGSRIRTSDTRIMIPLLYQLSYTAMICMLETIAGVGLEPTAFGL